MDNMRAFLIRIPELCGCQNAARIGEIFGFVYDRELVGGTPFDRNIHDRKHFRNRSKYLWDMVIEDANSDDSKIKHCRDLVDIIERSHYLDKHGETYQAAIIDTLHADAKHMELLEGHEEITEAMPADTAVALGGWNFG
jgi:hypothetical protein